MYTETTYSQSDLTSGKCRCCGVESDEILIDSDICVDCFESEKFYEQTIQGL